MPLTSFLPAVGPKAGISYTLPTQKQRPTLALNFAQDGVPLEQSSGLYLGAGQGAAFPADGQLQVVFVFSANWLVTASYAGTFGGMMSAIADFSRSVTMGGLGTLTDTPPANTKIGSLTVTTRVCSARLISADLLPLGDTSAELSATFQNPSGFWTCTMSDASKQLLAWPS